MNPTNVPAAFIAFAAMGVFSPMTAAVVGVQVLPQLMLGLSELYWHCLLAPIHKHVG